MKIPTDKIIIVGDRVIIAGTGAIGLGQRFHAVVDTHWKNNVFKAPCLDCLKSLASTSIQDFTSTGIQRVEHFGYGFGALLAAPLQDKAELVEFGLTDFQPELKTGKIFFATMGSGQQLADPFLAFISRVLWREAPPDVKNALFGVYWTLHHTIRFASGGVAEPIAIATLRRTKGQWQAELVQGEDLQEQSQHVQLIEEHIAQYPAKLIADAIASTPPQPPP